MRAGRCTRRQAAAAPQIVITLTGLLDEDLNTGPISSRALRPVLHAAPVRPARGSACTRLGAQSTTWSH